ncbi:Protease HtpX [Aureliella helgolandensis]|uniref:Protease HtpX n=2 Tax=Aureliella helgolandensis TaxID=2527968 RepID=A0A518G0N6_9BACT|nr:Protease HtpX [Aureliella helgolandensis]
MGLSFEEDMAAGEYVPGFAIEQPTQAPRRSDLLSKLESANRSAWLWVTAQMVAVAGAAFLIDWQRIINEPLLSAVAIGLMVGPPTMELMKLWAQNKKEIDDLKEDTRFGEFDKHLLRRLQRDTLRQLGLPDERVPVYITADKSLNASAVRLGLGAFFKSLNGIYLNRQILHRLDPQEVQDIMGHELGHYYKYYLVNSRFLALTFLLGGMVGLIVAQWTGMSSFFSVIISFACASGFWKITGLLWSKHGETIEYLCDDLGAHVHGVHVSINGLLKIGIDAETQMEIHHQALQATQHGSMSARSVVEAVQAAIPYGNPSREELEKAVERSLKLHARKESGISLGGFYRYLRDSESEQNVEDQLAEQRQMFEALQTLPRLPWESLLRDPQQIHFSENELHRLIDLLESRPTELLFRLPEEAARTGDVHPPLRNRILYLWYNRGEIEQSIRRSLA